MKNVAEQIWAYIHNELSPSDRGRFKNALENDPELQQKLEEAQSTDQMLKNMLPLIHELEDSDELTMNRLISEWESEHPEFRESPSVSSNKIVRFILPLAAAAVAAFILMAQPWDRGAINWQRTAYGSTPQLRGEPTVQPQYSRANLKEISTVLQDQIESNLAALTDNPPEWTLQISLQELAGGTLTIEIEGYPAANQSSSKRWTSSFQNQKKVHNALSTFGNEVAESLAGQTQP